MNGGEASGSGLARRPGPTVRTRVQELRPDSERRREDRLITEEPLEVRMVWPGRAAHRVWITMRTPGHDFELAAGWALHEGLVQRADDLAAVAYCTDADLRADQEFNVVTLRLAVAPQAEPPEQLDARSAGSSACGVCGRDTVVDAVALAGHSPTDFEPDPELIRSLPDRLRERQRLFDRTGGVHAAGLFTADGEPLVVREDVGRHNAVDKVTGARLLAGDPVTGVAGYLVLSGRIGAELVQKAVAAGVGAVVAVGAPTSLAVDLARSAELPVFGFTSERRTVRYA